MSIFENEYDLPGVYMYVLPDYSYGYDTSLFGSTDPVLIIGTAFNGPNNGQPIEIYSKEHASYVYGKVYDNVKQVESNLVAGIHDAWDRGCRTIYACRVGGIDMYKDFKFNIDVPYRLRVMSMFPSNVEKECFMRYENKEGQEKVIIYKPAERATVLQRRQGIVEGDNTMIKTTIEINGDYGLTKDTPLMDFINLINGHVDNNVIKLGIVDLNGKDVTNDLKVRSIAVGALFQGIYFIGREQSLCQEETELKFNIIDSYKDYDKNGKLTTVEGKKPFTRYQGNYYRTLEINTDVRTPYPIYATPGTMQKIMKDVGITVNVKIGREWDWLEVYRSTFKAFEPDNKDYEEVELGGFELYQRLGMGFAKTAQALIRKNSKGEIVIPPRIRETPPDNANNIVQLVDGYYSILQDVPIKYRVLTCTTAEASTKGKLPKAQQFIRTAPISLEALQSMITITPKVNEEDRTIARSYKLRFRNLPETSTANINEVYRSEVYDVMSIVDESTLKAMKPGDVPADTYFLKRVKKEGKGENDIDVSDYTYTLVRVGTTIEEIVSGGILAHKKIIGVTPALDLTRNADNITFKDQGNQYYFFAAQGIPETETTIFSDPKYSLGDKEIGETTIIKYTFVPQVGADLLGDPDAEVPQYPFRVVYYNDDGEKVEKNAKFILGSQLDNVFVYQIGAEQTEYNEGTANPTIDMPSATNQLQPVGDYNGMMSDDQNVPVVYAEDMFYQINDIIVNSSTFVDITLDEFVETLNEHEIFSKIFEISLTNRGESYKDERLIASIYFWQRSGEEGTYLYDEQAFVDALEGLQDPVNAFTLDNNPVEWTKDRSIDYDYNAYIPYTTTDNFARQLAQHCTYTELKTGSTWGFIGTGRVGAVDVQSVGRSVNEILAKDFSLYAKNARGRNMMDKENMPYPIGRNLSIIFTQYEEPIDTEDYTFISNGAAGYAGMVSTLPLDQSSTNQPFNVEKLSFYLARHQLAALNAKGVVALKRSFTLGTVVTDGTTMAPVESVFRRLSASRIVGAIEELIRAVAEPYIGKQNHDANRNSLHTAIKGQLDKLVGTLLEDYQFQLIVDSRAERYNYIDIEYELVPIYEIRQIRNRISVKERLTT